MGIRTKICFELSRRMMRPPEKKTVDYSAYDAWRESSLQSSWANGFSDDLVAGRDVLDFGCGDGQLSYFLSKHLRPKSVTGVDLVESSIDRARKNAPANGKCRFEVGSVEGLPFTEKSFDTIVAFDCMEHVMDPVSILKEWRRVLRPGGACAVEWFPYRGPWGPHMEALIPIPWAHVLFGERAMFRAAEAIYDLPEFIPRHWDLEGGQKKPNKWAGWSSFSQQGYINQLDVPGFRRMASEAGLKVTRLEKRGFSGNALRRALGSTLARLPLIGDFFVMYTLIEMRRE